MDTVLDGLRQFLQFTGFANMTFLHVLMICSGILVIIMSIRKDLEPLLLVPIGFGMIIGNIPFPEGFQIGIYEEGSVLNILYHGVQYGWYPPLISWASVP